MVRDTPRPSLCVYVEARELSVFLTWVEQTFGPCQKAYQVPEMKMCFYDVQVSGNAKPMTLYVTEQMDPLELGRVSRGYRETPPVPPDPVRDAHPIPITELDFYGSPPLWATSADLGKQLSRELGVDVLCDPPSEYGSARDEPGVFLFIRGGHEELLLLDV